MKTPLNESVGCRALIGKISFRLETTFSVNDDDDLKTANTHTQTQKTKIKSAVVSAIAMYYSLMYFFVIFQQHRSDYYKNTSIDAGTQNRKFNNFYCCHSLR